MLTGMISGLFEISFNISFSSRISWLSLRSLAVPLVPVDVDGADFESTAPLVDVDGADFESIAPPMDVDGANFGSTAAAIARLMFSFVSAGGHSIGVSDCFLSGVQTHS